MGEYKFMDDFPAFMKNPVNRILQASQATPGVEGYVFDGSDGSQMACWICHQTALSSGHAHDFDEYIVVVQGCYTLLIGDRRLVLQPGDEYLIPRGIWHSGQVIAGTRTIHAFGGHRADRPPTSPEQQPI
jgi:quercetin dioxygenase-like cupin family protein